MRHFDLAVIGTGPAGQKAAIQAAKLGKKVAIIEKNQVVGGVAINTGTIPSKALREAVIHLTGINRRGLFGQHYRMKETITIADLIRVSSQVIRKEWDVIRCAFMRNDIDLIWGKASFIDPHTIAIERTHDAEKITAKNIVIAIGTRPAKPATIPFDSESIFTSDELLALDSLPKNLIIVGGGVIGSEYACILAPLGINITLVEGRSKVLGFLDHEIIEAFQYHMRQMGITLRLNENVESIERIEQTDNGNSYVQAILESGKKLRAEAILYAVGRQGMCGLLDLEGINLAYDDRERLHVNEQYQTEIPHIYAAGDVIGFPALASTAMEQGRIAVCHAFGNEFHSMPELFPFGVYAIPEISMVGKTEEQLTGMGIPYEVGVAQYKELARGQLLGDETGMLKMLIHQETRKILGIHAIGTGATELIHIGQAVMALDAKVDYFVESVFNFPTLAEAYKVAALNGLNKLQYLDQ